MNSRDYVLEACIRERLHILGEDSFHLARMKLFGALERDGIVNATEWNTYKRWLDKVLGDIEHQ